jgi:hypothetical protein
MSHRGAAGPGHHRWSGDTDGVRAFEVEQSVGHLTNPYGYGKEQARKALVSSMLSTRLVLNDIEEINGKYFQARQLSTVFSIRKMSMATSSRMNDWFLLLCRIFERMHGADNDGAQREDGGGEQPVQDTTFHWPRGL